MSAEQKLETGRYIFLRLHRDLRLLVVYKHLEVEVFIKIELRYARSWAILKFDVVLLSKFITPDYYYKHSGALEGLTEDLDLVSNT